MIYYINQLFHVLAQKQVVRCFRFTQCAYHNSLHGYNKTIIGLMLYFIFI